MELKEKRSAATGLPAWAFSIFTALGSTIFLFAIGYPLEKFSINGLQVGDWITYISTGIVIAIACFLICRKYPASYWYVPVISNAIGIFAAFVEPNFWKGSMAEQNIIVWLLSLSAALLGAWIGSRASSEKT